MGKDKKNFVMLGLIIVIILLLGVLAYMFVITPAINGLVVKGYNQAQIDIITAILTQLKNNGYVQIPVGPNQTIVLVPYTQPAEQSAQK